MTIGVTDLDSTRWLHVQVKRRGAEQFLLSKYRHFYMTNIMVNHVTAQQRTTSIVDCRPQSQTFVCQVEGSAKQMALCVSSKERCLFIHFVISRFFCVNSSIRTHVPLLPNDLCWVPVRYSVIFTCLQVTVFLLFIRSLASPEYATSSSLYARTFLWSTQGQCRDVTSYSIWGYHSGGYVQFCVLGYNSLLRPVSCHFLAWLTLRLLMWRPCVPSKCRLPLTGLRTINVILQHPVGLRRSDFAFCFYAVCVQRRFFFIDTNDRDGGPQHRCILRFKCFSLEVSIHKLSTNSRIVIRI
jgi:hypothetical protein